MTNKLLLFRNCPRGQFSGMTEQNKELRIFYLYQKKIYHNHTEKKTWYCGQASCSLFTNFFGKKVTTNSSLSKLQTKFKDYRLNR